MHRELPIYIFIRNTVALCILFFFVSAYIIEKGRQEHGESSIFKDPSFKSKQVIDHKNTNAPTSANQEPVNAYINITEKKDSVTENTGYNVFPTILVKNSETYSDPSLIDL